MGRNMGRKHRGADGDPGKATMRNDTSWGGARLTVSKPNSYNDCCPLPLRQKREKTCHETHQQHVKVGAHYNKT